MAKQKVKKDQDFALMQQRVKKTLFGKGKDANGSNEKGELVKSKKLNTSKPKRNALGRGLSALMASSAVEVPAQPQTKAIERPMPSSPTNHQSSPVTSPVTDIEQLRERRIDQAGQGQVENRSAESNQPVYRNQESVDGVSGVEATTAAGDGLVYVAIDKIIRNAAQPRQDFAEHELEALAQSIKKSGLLQPILLRRLDGGVLEIVAGERRWRAARRAGLDKVPAIIRELEDKEAFGLAIVENLQREDLNPIEEALAYQRLIEEFGESQGEVAQTVGKDRASVANALRLLKLPTAVRDLLRNKKLSAGHGRALLMLEDTAKQQALAEKIIREGMSVRSAEREASGLQKPKIPGVTATIPSNSSEKNLAIVALEERLRRGLGTKVVLTSDPDGKGEVRISYFSQAELESLLERLGV